ncbi:unnamed protein product [Linum trigynum]|uniref:F-box domain-containing protein n=1 Tax=Linum trigynum TaxID=586398 RepID=A0AAV2C7Y9_9ROSI
MAGNSKVSKISKRSRVVKEVDGLSDLPDNILHHILSFLDTKSAVQTSLLSRRWRCCWKHVPVLYFRPLSFTTYSSFRKHVCRVLSRRFHNTPVRNVTFEVYEDEWNDIFQKTFEKIMKYAASNGDGGGLHSLTIICDEFFELDFREHLADCITAAHHNESLKTMKLVGCNLKTGALDLGFRSLTTLELYKCSLETVNPFANLPCLNYLKILECFVYHTDFLMISGLQLLDLEIKIDFYDEYEVLAPKLKSLRLCLWGDNLHNYLPKLTVPVLDHANIYLWWNRPDIEASMVEVNRAFVDFLLTLRNAESVKLRFDKFGAGDEDWEEHHFPLRRIKALLETEVPSFTRLKSLTIQSAHQDKPPEYLTR